MRKSPQLIGGMAICVMCFGCSRAPSVGIIGSFFPVWMICLAIGVVAAFAIHSLLLRYEFESRVQPLWVFYPSAVILCSCLFWLVFFR